MMIGNSLKSDVVPAIEAGGWGVYVPHELTWALSTRRRRRIIRASDGSSSLESSQG